MPTDNGDCEASGMECLRYSTKVASLLAGMSGRHMFRKRCRCCVSYSRKMSNVDTTETDHLTLIGFNLRKSRSMEDVSGCGLSHLRSCRALPKTLTPNFTSSEGTCASKGACAETKRRYLVC